MLVGVISLHIFDVSQNAAVICTPPGVFIVVISMSIGRLHKTLIPAETYNCKI